MAVIYCIILTLEKVGLKITVVIYHRIFKTFAPGGNLPVMYSFDIASSVPGTTILEIILKKQFNGENSCSWITNLA